MGRRLFEGLLCLVGFGVAAMLLLAPQVPVLMREGFPAPRWPARGHFVEVLGVAAAAPAAITDLPVAAQRRLHGSGGAVLLADHGGGPVLGAYADGAGPDTLFNSYSLVKSLVGVLVLKAMDEGRVTGLQMRLPEVLNRSDVPDVSLDDLLRMTSGLALSGEPPKDEKAIAADDEAFSPFSPVGRLHAFGIAPMVKRLSSDTKYRGTFHYQSVNTALLGLVLEHVYGLPLAQLLSDKIWRPAGAETAYWRRIPGGDAVSAYCCLYARAEDWCRVGRYLLENGEEGAFLSEPLWRDWLLPDLGVEARRAGVYGWHLRHDVLDREGEALQGSFAYMAGHLGQRVYLVPNRNLVVVRFGAAPQLLHSTLYDLVQ